MKKLSLILLSSMLVFLISCKKETPSSGTPNNPTPNNPNELSIGNTNLIAYGNPVVDENDNVYMTFSESMMLDAETQIICIGSDNTKKWQTTINEPINSLTMTGNSIIATGLSKVYALNSATGTKSWDYQITIASGLANTKGVYKPCIDGNGNIIIAMDSYLENISDAKPARLISLSSTGSLNWERELTTGDSYDDRFTKLSEPFAVNNKIHFSAYFSDSNAGTDYVKVFAYSYAGQKENEASFGSYHPGSSILCVNNYGDLYFGLRDADYYTTKLKRLNSDLTEQWEVSLPDYVNNKGVIDAQGNFYTTCEDGFVYKHNTNGTEVWKSNFGNIFVRGELFIASDGNIYKNSQTPSYINSQTGVKTDIAFSATASTEIAIRSTGVIVLGGAGKVFFANTTTNGISTDAIWPKYGFNIKNQSLFN